MFSEMLVSGQSRPKFKFSSKKKKKKNFDTGSLPKHVFYRNC